MYATVRSYPGSQELVETLLGHQQDIRDLIGGIDGFRAYYLARDSSGDLLTISIFDDQAGADASTSAAADWIRENLADMSVGAPNVTTGEVVFSI